MLNLPNKVNLLAMNKQWKITYVESPGKLLIIEHPHRELALYGKNYSKKAAIHLITRWVLLKAHEFLVALLKKLNRRVRVKYKKLIIRSHEWQWGSYSSNKTISLNYKLIFLPLALVKHIIYHELCHVNCLDHSPAFWKSVARYDKNWRANRTAMDDADYYIPKWAE